MATWNKPFMGTERGWGREGTMEIGEVVLEAEGRGEDFSIM